MYMRKMSSKSSALSATTTCGFVELKIMRLYCSRVFAVTGTSEMMPIDIMKSMFGSASQRRRAPSMSSFVHGRRVRLSKSVTFTVSEPVP